MVDPDIWTDNGFIELGWGARLLFIGMISRADDEGRGNASSKSLKAVIFPGDDVSLLKIDGFKAEIEKYTRSKFYDVNGQSYYQLSKWFSYQQIQHPKPSAIPPFIEHSLNDTVPVNEHSPQLTNELVNKLNRADSMNVLGKSLGPSKMRPGDLDAFSSKEKIKTMFSGIVPQEAKNA
jgi:hypothetical protein